MMSRCGNWRDVAIGSGDMTLCLNDVKIGLFKIKAWEKNNQSLNSWGGQGNPIVGSMICDIHDPASLVVYCKSWTL